MVIVFLSIPESWPFTTHFLANAERSGVKILYSSRALTSAARGRIRSADNFVCCVGTGGLEPEQLDDLACWRESPNAKVVFVKATGLKESVAMSQDIELGWHERLDLSEYLAPRPVATSDKNWLWAAVTLSIIVWPAFASPAKPSEMVEPPPIPTDLRQDGGKYSIEKKLEYCQSNLKNIGTALEMYATDNVGDYPPDLTFLLDAYYLRAVPTCPAVGYDTYSRGFSTVKGQKEFEVQCSGYHHSLTSRNFPRYNNAEGLISDKPKP